MSDKRPDYTTQKGLSPSSPPPPQKKGTRHKSATGASMNMAETTVGIPGLVIICVDCGQVLLEKFRTFKSFESEIKDLSQNAEGQWLALKAKIELIARLDDSFQKSERDHFEKVVGNLRIKLEDLKSRVDSIHGKSEGIFGQLKSAFRPGRKGLNQLKEAIIEFATLHKTMGASFLLLAKLSGPGADQKIKDEPTDRNTSISTVQKLRKALADLKAARHPQTPEEVKIAKNKRQYIREAVRFNADNSYWNERKAIQYTSVQTHDSREDNRMLMIDSVPCDGNSPGAANIIRDVQELALILQSIDDPMDFGTLACVGIVKAYKDRAKVLTSLEMVLKVPKELINPRSLRSLLTSGVKDTPHYSISARIEFSKQLARTFSFFHSAGFVHKNFRPETIIVFDSRQQNTNRIGTPFLVGFQKFRAATSNDTAKLGDTAWEKNVYRHPDRQGEFPEEVYRMEHDIYSLGVCLLEIALWKSFVVYDSNDLNPKASPESARWEHLSGPAMKDELVEMAREMIPITLGEIYAEVTVACLEGLDEADEMVGASYIENILDKLDRITV